jgi:hypothetical protein
LPSGRILKPARGKFKGRASLRYRDSGLFLRGASREHLVEANRAHDRPDTFEQD